MRGIQIKQEKIKEAIPYLGIVLVLVVFGISTHGALLSARSISSVVNEAFMLLLGASAMIFLMAQGNLDLSMMGNMAVSCAMGVYAAQINVYLALPVTVLTGAAIGLINGVIHTKGKIDAFITTVGMSFVLSGSLILIMRNRGALMAPMEMLKWNNIPLRVITIIVICSVLGIVFEFGTFGKKCKAIGSCEEAARQSGVNVIRTKLFAFMLTGSISGLLAFFSIIRTGTAAASVSSSTMFNILISVLLGGVSITGGSSSKFRSAVIGGLTMAFLSVGMTLCNIDTTIQQLIKGLIFIIVVGLTFDRRGVVIVK